MEGKKPLLVCVEGTGGIQITESSTKKGTYVARGLFAKGDVETANKRVYPSTIFKREIDKLSEDIKNHRVMGELDHPFDGKTKLSRTSHIITDLRIDDKGDVYGEAEIIDTQKGKDLKAILEAGGQVGVSSRGFGTVKKVDGKMLVQDDFSLQTFDFVANPAQKEAYPKIFAEAEGSDVAEVDAKLENIERDFPHLYDEMREAVRSEMQSEIDEAVNKRVAEQKPLLEEEIRKKVDNDNSGDKGKNSVSILESIVNIMQPILDESKKDDRVAGLNARIKDLQAGLSEATGYAKVAGYNLCLERELNGMVKEDRDTVVSIVGDVSRFDNLDELKNAVKAAKDKVVSMAESKNAAVHEKNEAIDKLHDKISKLESRLETIGRELTASKRVTEVRERLKDNPLVEEAIVRAEGGEDVDEIISEISSRNETDSLIESVSRAKRRDGRGNNLDELLEETRLPFNRNGKYASSPTPVLPGNLFEQSLEISKRLNKTH